MTGEPDGMSRLLGRLEAYAETDIQAHRELRAVVEGISDDVRKLVIATADLPELKVTVARHEKQHQRFKGVAMAISAFVSLVTAGGIEWFRGH